MSLIVIIITIYIIYYYSKKSPYNTYVPPPILAYPIDISNPQFLDNCNKVNCSNGLICDPIDFLCKYAEGMTCLSNQCGPNLMCSGKCVPLNTNLGEVGDFCPCNSGYECNSDIQNPNSGYDYCYIAGGYNCNNNQDCISQFCNNGICAYQSGTGYQCGGNKFCISGNCSELGDTNISYCQPIGITSGYTLSNCSQFNECLGENLYCIDGICTPVNQGLLAPCNNTFLCNPNYICMSPTGSTGFSPTAPKQSNGKCYYPYLIDQNQFVEMILFNYTNNQNNTILSYNSNSFPNLIYNNPTISTTSLNTNNITNFSINTGGGISFNNSNNTRYNNMPFNDNLCYNNSSTDNNCIYQIQYNNGTTAGLEFVGAQNVVLTQIIYNNSINASITIDKFFYCDYQGNQTDYFYFMLNSSASINNLNSSNSSNNENFNGLGFYYQSFSSYPNFSFNNNSYYQIIQNPFISNISGISGDCYITSVTSDENFLHMSFYNNNAGANSNTYYIYNSTLSNLLTAPFSFRSYLINDTNFSTYFKSYNGTTGEVFINTSGYNNANISIQCLDTNGSDLIATDQLNDIYIYTGYNWYPGNSYIFSNNPEYITDNHYFNYQPNSVNFYNDTEYVCFGCTTTNMATNQYQCSENNILINGNTTINNFYTKCPSYRNFTYQGQLNGLVRFSNVKTGYYTLSFTGNENNFIDFNYFLPSTIPNPRNKNYYVIVDYSIYSNTISGISNAYIIMIVIFRDNPSNAFIILDSIANGKVMLPYPVNPSTKCLATDKGYFLAFNAYCN